MNAQTKPDTNHRPARKASQHDQAGQTGSDRQNRRPAARKAAASALSQRSFTAVLPCGLGTVRIPSREHLAFYGGVLALGLFGIVDWPVVLIIGIGHVLADDHQHKVIARFGAALEEA